MDHPEKWSNSEWEHQDRTVCHFLHVSCPWGPRTFLGLWVWSFYWLKQLITHYFFQDSFCSPILRLFSEHERPCPVYFYIWLSVSLLYDILYNKLVSISKCFPDSCELTLFQLIIKTEMGIVGTSTCVVKSEMWVIWGPPACDWPLKEGGQSYKTEPSPYGVCTRC